MKILHTADWHIGNFIGPEKEGKNLRAIDTGNCLNHMELIAMCERPDIMVVSGDIFHQAHVWSDRGLDETRQAIQAIEAFAAICPVIVLRGTPNHDGAGQFELLKKHFDNNKNVCIFTEPDVITVHSFKGEPLQVAALPGFDKGVFRAKFPGISREDENQAFTQELGNIVLGLKTQCSNDIPSVLITHYTVPGCNTESGQMQFWSKAEPVIEPSILETAGFDLVALGHIHKPQQLDVCSNTFYSGAVNALNFNDEGQDRGFYMHDINKFSSGWVRTNSRFYKTPSREFITIKLGDEDIKGINGGGLDITASRLWLVNDSVKDKIVRVLYSCSEADNKAFNKSLLEKKLYSDGAFWVSEIIPVNTEIEVNKDLLSEESSPEANLVNYLNEKGISGQRINEILDLARPIINGAVAGNITSVLTGLFVPVEIEVKNYRNYREEIFNYEGINFCTINGSNGVGKSSLFMDAILDCIYEEPREGDLTGWISNDIKARSGSISFTFKIGDKSYRIVRTRAKSGKATLNLSELVEGEWSNRSKEKLRDTQEDIINLVGMDSLTFKSCALIMQDQYGLFLQADKESRMSILANILGLKIYDTMEGVVRDKATNLNRSIKENKDRITKLTASLPDSKIINEELSELKTAIDNKTDENKELHNRADMIKLRLNTKFEAAERLKKLNEVINSLIAKRASTEDEISKQQTVISNSEVILSQEPEIIQGVNSYNKLLEKEKQLLKGKALYNSKINEYESTVIEMTTISDEVNKLADEKASLDSKIKELEAKTVNEDMLKEKSEEYEIEKKNLSALEEKAEKYVAILNDIAMVENKKSELRSVFEKECAERTAEIKSLKTKIELLNSSGCIDKDSAKCKFLNDAKEAQLKLEPYVQGCTEWKKEKLAKIGELEKLIDSYKDTQTELNYSTEILKEKRNKVEILEIQAKLYSTVRLYKDQINIYNERLEAVTESISELESRIKNTLIKKSQLEIEVEEMKSAATDFDIVQGKISIAKKWIDMEKLIPMAKAQKETAVTRIAELDTELIHCSSDMNNKRKEIVEETKTAEGSEDLKNELLPVMTSIEDNEKYVQEANRKIGTLETQIKIIEDTGGEINILQDLIKDTAFKVAVYEELKTAFSQDGIPHNIIKSVLPMLEATANNMLGQMSGGRMSMEFITEKVLKSNNKKEVVTLDIIISEAGIGSLPYLSKSGGERVKAALSAILALAEIKSSKAGVQLGMLFIDEPPFLDGDGIQAYCDALETIQSRYSNLKVMAITHDPTMKARFPQSIEVEKTNEGSKVVYCA